MVFFRSRDNRGTKLGSGVLMWIELRKICRVLVLYIERVVYIAKLI